jgi:hypothetical protein
MNASKEFSLNLETVIINRFALKVKVLLSCDKTMMPLPS